MAMKCLNYLAGHVLNKMIEDNKLKFNILLTKLRFDEEPNSLEDWKKQKYEENNLFMEPDMFQQELAPTGWICPVCGAGMSPYINKCNCNTNYTNTGPRL